MTGKPIEIRTMTIADYDDALALWKATEGMGLSAADERGPIARYLERNPGMSFVACTPQGEVVATVLCGHDGRRALLHHLAVRADYRHQGLGSALVDRCLAAVHAEGIDKCHLMVYENNAPGRAFWQRTGWYERPELVLMSKDMND